MKVCRSLYDPEVFLVTVWVLVFFYRLYCLTLLCRLIRMSSSVTSLWFVLAPIGLDVKVVGQYRISLLSLSTCSSTVELRVRPSVFLCSAAFFFCWLAFVGCDVGKTVCLTACWCWRASATSTDNTAGSEGLMDSATSSFQINYVSLLMLSFELLGCVQYFTIFTEWRGNLKTQLPSCIILCDYIFFLLLGRLILQVSEDVMMSLTWYCK